MIISMKLHATRQEIDEVRKQVEHFGYKCIHRRRRARVIASLGRDVTACMESIEAMPSGQRVRISAP